LFVIGEANFSDHGANRLGASALMQGLADGYFVLPNTLPNYLAGQMGKRPSPDCPEFLGVEESVRARIEKLLSSTALAQSTRSIENLACFFGTNADVSSRKRIA
jgi:succinate dehydrogenase / fumarate reductase flavoprotein subunit